MVHSFLGAILIPAALILAASETPPQEATEVDVTLANFSFAPNPIQLEADHRYILKLNNTASGGHSFSAPEFFKTAQVDAADQPLIRKGKVDVPGGSTVAVRLKTGAAGTYKLKCTHFLHSGFGMTGQIVVT